MARRKPTFAIQVDSRRMEHDKIIKFDCRQIDLGFHREDWPGTFHTGFTISPWAYRQQHPTKAQVNIITTKWYVKFVMISDHGARSVVLIPKRQYWSQILEAARAADQEHLLGVVCAHIIMSM